LPKDITSAQLRSGAYRVAQHSGSRNSLGRIIFRFNNQFDVYLHDTNNKNAFNYDRRTISHGCVRIQRPFDMVKFLMPDAEEWTLDKIRMNIDMSPEGDKGKRFLLEHEDDEDPLKGIKLPYVSVKPHIPIVIDYYTLYPNPETGKWDTWPDRYEYDKQIARRIKPFMP
jgi:murein L,D-transpeptidase YcbB/YkuD